MNLRLESSRRLATSLPRRDAVVLRKFQVLVYIHGSLTADTEKRAKAIADRYSVYESEIASEVMRVSWCYSFYYTYLAYVILLDCDDHASLARS